MALLYVSWKNSTIVNAKTLTKNNMYTNMVGFLQFTPINRKKNIIEL